MATDPTRRENNEMFNPYMAVRIDKREEPPKPFARIAPDTSAEWVGRGVAEIIRVATEDLNLNPVEVQQAMMAGFQGMATQSGDTPHGF